MFEILSTCKGGGYKYCRTNPPHPKRNAKGLYPLHRVLLENKLGRLLEDHEDSHHIDEDKKNNDPINLEVKTHLKHIKHHAQQRTFKPLDLLCSCGIIFQLKPYIHKKRVERNKTGVFCSRSCAAYYSHPNNI